MQKMTMAELKRDIVCSVFVLALGGFLLFFTKDIFTGAGALKAQLMIDSTFFPSIVAWFLMGLGALLLGKTLYGYRQLQKAQPKPEQAAAQKAATAGLSLKTLWNDHADILSIFLLAAYVLSLSTLGYLLATILYLALQMGIMSTKENRNLKLILVLSVTAALLIYLIFSKGFSLPLPRGLLSFL